MSVSQSVQPLPGLQWVRPQATPHRPRPTLLGPLLCRTCRDRCRFTTVTFPGCVLPPDPPPACASQRGHHSQFYPFALHGNNLASITVRVSVCLSLTWGATHRILSSDSHVRVVTVVVFIFLSFLSRLGLSIVCLHQEVAPRTGPSLLAQTVRFIVRCEFPLGMPVCSRFGDSLRSRCVLAELSVSNSRYICLQIPDFYMIKNVYTS